MKRLILSVITFIMLLTFLSFFVNNVNAYDWSTKINSIDAKNDSSNVANSTQNVVGAALQIARIVAVGVALIMLTVLAMKYMYAAPGDKATIKQHAVVYIVGAVVLFASSAILGIIQDFANKNIN